MHTQTKIQFTGDSAYLDIYGDSVGKTEAEQIAEANASLIEKGWIGYEVFESATSVPTEYHFLAGLK